MSIDEVFKKHEVSAGQFAPFYPFEKDGDNVAGKIINSHESQFSTQDNPQTVYDIKTFEEEIYALPTSTVATSLYKNSNLKIGDYVKMTYKGEVKSKRGRNVKDFTLSVVDGETFEKMFPKQKISSDAVPQAPKPKKAEKAEMTDNELVNAFASMILAGKSQFEATKALADKTGKSIKEIKELVPEEKKQQAEATEKPSDKAKDFVKDLIEFYDEISVKEFEAATNSAHLGFNPEEILELCKDFIKVENDLVLRK